MHLFKDSLELCLIHDGMIDDEHDEPEEYAHQLEANSHFLPRLPKFERLELDSALATSKENKAP